MTTKKRTQIGAHGHSNSLVDKLDIFAIGLDSMNARVDRPSYANAYAEDKKQITRRISSDYKVTDFSKEHFDVTAILSLRVESACVQDPLLELDIAVSGHFHPKKALSKDEAVEFASVEARLIFWPYFRQLVSDTTGRMHIGIITLPLTAG